jgi:hypothetical protein
MGINGDICDCVRSANSYIVSVDRESSQISLSYDIMRSLVQ